MVWRALFPPHDEDVAQAQWALVTALEQAAGNDRRRPEASRALRQLLAQVRAGARTPHEWAATLAQALLEQLAQQATATQAAREISLLQQQVEIYRRALEAERADPLAGQVERLTGERDQLQGQVDRLVGQARNLTATLERVQQTRQTEVGQLNAEIAALNRIIVQQEEALRDKK